MKNFLKGHYVWLFMAIFFAAILMFFSRNMPNPTNAGWFIGVTGGLSAYILQAWHHSKYKTTCFDWLNVGIAIFVFVVAALIRSFCD